MRKLTDHIVNPANDKLTIEVLDEPGQGGASHLYGISGFDYSTNPSKEKLNGFASHLVHHAVVLFQNGPINEFGVNGITHEALLAILADRLRSFQAGSFASDYNAAALAHIESAQGCLQDRTRSRMAQGIEGTHVVGEESKPDRSTDGIAESIEAATTKLD